MVGRLDDGVLFRVNPPAQFVALPRGDVVQAAEAARQEQMKVVAFTGEGGGNLAPLAHALLAVPSRHTPRIQEGHLALYHYLCEMVEAQISTEENAR